MVVTRDRIRMLDARRADLQRTTGVLLLPPLVHVLVELNAHVNWDLPQALLAVVDDDLASGSVLASRFRDHDRINAVLAGRTVAEGRRLNGRLGGQLMLPVNTWLTHRFLPRARAEAWHNVLALAAARREGPAAYADRLHDLDALASAKVSELLEPRWALVRATLRGFGVTLPPVRPGCDDPRDRATRPSGDGAGGPAPRASAGGASPFEAARTGSNTAQRV